MSNDFPEMMNWFDQGGSAYERFRPGYPPKLSTFLASHSPHDQLAVDVGCGNGQLTELLTRHFRRVIGLDPSADQIANATFNERITYKCAKAENLPVADGSASLVTAAQAAHWFDLPYFFREVRRIIAPKGVVALISYGVLNIDSHLNDRFQRFYWDEIGHYWPPARRLVENGYQTIDFPFEEIPPPHMEISLSWSLEEFLGYLSTWSSVRIAREAGREDVLRNFANDISHAWGEKSTRRSITWPVNMRVGHE